MQATFISLGSNEGDRLHWFEKACNLITNRFGTIVNSSSVYETAAWGNINQPDFLNKVILVHTQLSPEDAIATLLDIEVVLGRKRALKWGQRTIDLDILFYGDLVINTPNLTVPHPFIEQRRFTLMPLAEIAPEYIHPVLGTTILELLQNCADTLPVKKYA